MGTTERQKSRVLRLSSYHDLGTLEFINYSCSQAHPLGAGHRYALFKVVVRLSLNRGLRLSEYVHRTQREYLVGQGYAAYVSQGSPKFLYIDECRDRVLGVLCGSSLPSLSPSERTSNRISSRVDWWNAWSFPFPQRTGTHIPSRTPQVKHVLTVTRSVT